MTARSTASADALPDGVPADARNEIVRFVEQLPDHTSCVATGSLVEGIGNANSDIDLYIIHDSNAMGAKPISIGIRRGRFIDCEYMSEGSIDSLAMKFVDLSQAELAELALRDFSRYYRLAIGVPLVVTGRTADILDKFSKERACKYFSQWCYLRAHQHMARATVSNALGDTRQARILLQEAALWRASAVLAAAGEGYPSLKWSTVKAARRFGSDSPEFRDCLSGYIDGFDDLDDHISRLRRTIPSPPEDLLNALREENWVLNDDTEVVSDDGLSHLVLGKRSIAQVSGLTAAIVAKLRYERWEHVVAAVAADLSVSVEQIRTVASSYMRELNSLDYLVDEAKRKD